MIYNQKHIENLRELFCDAVVKIFGSTEDFLCSLENEEYSNKYDCFLDGSGENYIINRETGEYINWYKLTHIGRCINISVLSDCFYISEWLREFLIDFKKEVSI